MNAKTPVKPEDRPEKRIDIRGVGIDLVRMGSGKTCLFLHTVDGVHPKAPFLQAMAGSFDVVAPWHPGFGHSDLPRHYRTVHDLALFYLDLIAELDIRDAVLVGTSFGGWLAAEIAIMDTRAFSHVVLLDPLGIKVGGREERDILDFYATSHDEMIKRTYHDTANRKRDFSQMSDWELWALARSRETYTYLGWEPYMHNPTLKHWLRRIDKPTLVAYGASDRVVAPGYGKAFTGFIPGARYEEIAEAGHYPAVEQPQRTFDVIRDFVGVAARRSAA